MSDLSESEKAIFRVALSLEDGEERRQFLANACRGNAPLRDEIDLLLAEDARDDGFLALGDEVMSSVDATIANDESPSESIGRYKLLQQIGEGGFGDVYMAEQTEPVVRRVALKIVKLGMDTRQVIARFEAERQALAMMDHPHIAKVFDAGATNRGRPYFVMELVRGNPVTEFCDQHRLNTEQRLRLFADICGAVQHAHQKGIIHRDLKPSNLLVSASDEGPVPKIIDFGIVKATQHRLTDKTLFTRFEQFIGIPIYMSPEQADPNRADVDTRSDVYSLGVVLYELLTGQTPINREELRGTSFDEVRRQVCERQPPTPSTQLATLSQADRTTIATNRGADPKLLDSLLRRELDWVVMKALEKERTRRYPAVSELEADIRRYLAGAPVTAVPPTTLYKLRKFAGRHRSAIVGAAAVSIMLVMATIMSAWQAANATHSLQVSRKARAELALDKGQMLGEQGEANRAMLWMARSLELVPKQDSELEQVIRTNLDGWRHQVNHVIQMLTPTGRVDAIAYLDSAKIVTAARQENDGVIVQTWNLQNGHCIKTIKHTHGRVLALSLRDDASSLALGYADGRVELLDLASGESFQLEKQRGFITKLLFSPDGSRLLVACGHRAITEQEGANEHSGALKSEGLVQLFDARTRLPQLKEQLRQPNLVWAADFAKDGTWFAIHSGRWLIPSKGLVSFWKISGEPHRASLQVPVSAMSIAISSDSKYLLTGDSLRRTRRWDLNTDQIVDQFSSDGPVSFVDFHPVDEDLVLAGSYDGSVRLWNLRSGRSLGPPLQHRALVRCAGFSKDGKVLYSGSYDAVQLIGLAHSFDTQSRPPHAPAYPMAFDSGRETVLVKEQDSLQLRTTRSGQAIGKSVPWKGPVIQAACDRQLSRAVSIGFRGAATLWDLHTGQAICKLRHGKEIALSAAISEQGLVAVGFFDGVAAIFDARSGNPIDQEFAHDAHTGPVFSVQFHDQRLLTGGADGFARLWNLETGEALGSFHHPTYCTAVFSRDGSRIATSGSDQCVRLWSVQGELLSSPLRHPARTLSMMFSEDDRMLLTGSLDGKARLWDVATSRPLAPAMVHGEETDSDQYVRVALWPDQRTLLTTTGSSNIGLASKATPAVYREIPTPMQGAASDIKLWVETTTGMTLDENGAADVLSVDAWRARRDQLAQRGFGVEP